MVSAEQLISILLISTITVEINSQYIDFFEDLQALFQHGNNGPRQDIATRRPASRKINDKRPNKHNGNAQFAVTDKNGREHSSTTAKPRRKSTRAQSSQNRRTTKNPYSEYLKIVNNIFTATPNYNFNNNGDDDDNDNNFGKHSLLTDDNNNTNNKDSTTRRTIDNSNKNRGVNNRNKGVNGKLINDNNAALNSAANYEFNGKPNDGFGDEEPNINRGRPKTDNGVADVDADNNGVTSSPNRGRGEDFAGINNNVRVDSYTAKNPANLQKVKAVNFGSNNFGASNRRPNAQTDAFAPPITNMPDAEPDGGHPRPGAAFADAADIAPDLEIGPDEDDMTVDEKRRYIEIAEEVCDSYKSLYVKKAVALPLVPQPQGQGVEFNVSDCKPFNNPLIIGGKVSSIEEFPHMALVGWMKIQRNAYSWKCGGSLISDQYLLTAGHCTFFDKDDNVITGPPHAVQLGSARLDDPAASVMKISSVIRHPKYKIRRSYYDVALIKMDSRVAFTKKIRPACLGVPPDVGQPIIATGWGRTEFGGDNSKELRSVSIPIWEMEDCKEIWGTSLKLPNGPSSDSQLCAGERKGGKDTCQGDSGGPAQIQDECVWRIVAVTSYGRSCGARDTPALYATIPRAFVSAQVFGKRKPNTGNSNQNNDNRNNPGNRNGGQKLNGSGDRNNNQQQIGNRYNNQQQIGNRYNNQQQIGDRNNNQQLVDRFNNQQPINIYNNEQLGNKYPNQQQQLGAQHFTQQLGFQYNKQQQTQDRYTNQQTDNGYNNQQQFGTIYDSQQRFGNRYDSQPQFGTIYDSQPQFGNRYDSQPQFGNRYDSQQQFGNRYNSQYGLGDAYSSNKNSWDSNAYRVTERPWWSR